MERPDSGRTKICLGLAGTFTFVSLLLLMRGAPNDSHMAIIVFSIALLQLFEYGVWKNQDCFPGGSNDMATRGAYTLFWLLPSILAFSGYLFGSFVVAENMAYGMLLMSGILYAFLTLSLITIMFSDKSTWCTTPGENGQPIWWFLRNSSPLNLNILWIIGILIPIILVDPLIIGSGILTIVAGACSLARQVDPSLEGEWVSSSTLLANGIAFWALIAPYIRNFFFFPIGTHYV
jgi:hypothetical protein